MAMTNLHTAAAHLTLCFFMFSNVVAASSHSPPTVNAFSSFQLYICISSFSFDARREEWMEIKLEEKILKQRIWNYNTEIKKQANKLKSEGWSSQWGLTDGEIKTKHKDSACKIQGGKKEALRSSTETEKKSKK